jgi:RNA polymerase sigma-32 factor
MPRNVVADVPDSLRSYFADINRTRVLTFEEEQTLARAYRETGDPALAHRLVTASLRFVVKIAHSYRSCGARLTDLIQEGNLGLVNAVQHFDPETVGCASSPTPSGRSARTSRRTSCGRTRS